MDNRKGEDVIIPGVEFFFLRGLGLHRPYCYRVSMTDHALGLAPRALHFLRSFNIQSN